MVFILEWVRWSVEDFLGIFSLTYDLSLSGFLVVLGEVLGVRMSLGGSWGGNLSHDQTETGEARVGRLHPQIMRNSVGHFGLFVLYGAARIATEGGPRYPGRPLSQPASGRLAQPMGRVCVLSVRCGGRGLRPAPRRPSALVNHLSFGRFLNRIFLFKNSASLNSFWTATVPAHRLGRADRGRRERSRIGVLLVADGRLRG